MEQAVPMRDGDNTQTGLPNVHHSPGEHNHLWRLPETVSYGGQTHPAFRYVLTKDGGRKEKQMGVDSDCIMGHTVYSTSGISVAMAWNH